MTTINDLYRVKNDAYGNPRVVIHFLNLLTEKEKNENINKQYTLARIRARRLGGKIYRGKDFGGGFVFQTYDNAALINKINNDLKNK